MYMKKQDHIWLYQYHLYTNIIRIVKFKHHFYTLIVNMLSPYYISHYSFVY